MSKRIITSAIIAIAVLTTSQAYARGAFTFSGIEFAPADQRLPAAQQYLRDQAPPGTPLHVAIASMRKAQAHCGSQPEPNGTIRCRYSRSVSNSATDMYLGDVTWTVSLFPAANDTIARATVVRETRGL